jgi:diguanylate cyclase (GGDEF)-like protein
VPVSIGGKTVSVVHATAPDGHPPDSQAVSKVEMIARKVGERVGLLRAFQRSETQAHTDPLTGLMNRRSLEEKVRALSEDGHTYVAAYGDLDHFKQLNDVYGHDAGDQALRLFARVLRDTVRPDDLTARYGGEEFVVVLPEQPIEGGTAFAERVRERVADAAFCADDVSGGIRTTISVGIATYPIDNTQTSDELIARADEALYRAKAAGRDRVHA